MFYLRRLEGGLFTLQMIDFILAWLIMEDDGVRLCSSSFPSVLYPPALYSIADSSSSLSLFLSVLRFLFVLLRPEIKPSSSFPAKTRASRRSSTSSRSNTTTSAIPHRHKRRERRLGRSGRRNRGRWRARG
jgi:hypothetical protein